MEAASKGGNANEARLQDQQAYLATLQVKCAYHEYTGISMLDVPF